MTFDLSSIIKVLGDSVTTQTDDTAQTVSVDAQSADGLAFLVSLGTVADANATFALLVEDSDDNSAWTAVADDFLIGVEAVGLQFDSDNKTAKIGYKGVHRYVRATLTPSGNTGQADIAILALGKTKVGPNSTQVV